MLLDIPAAISVDINRDLIDWITLLASVIGVASTAGAVVVAAIALRFSRQANSIAQRVYIDDVRARNEAQARLVYALPRGSSVYFKGERISPHDGEYSMTEVGGNVLGTGPEDQANDFYALEDMQVVDMEIHNASTEVIGTFQAQLYDPVDDRVLPDSIGAEFVLPGQSTELIRIAVPGTSRTYLPEISFRDSAGLYWSRRGFEPVQSLDAQRRKLFSDLQDLRRVGP